jgi:NitT/TauT family transport system substrate-binding protein
MRRLLGPVVVLSCLSALCGGSAFGAGVHRSAPQSLTKVNFILNWLPNVQFAGLWAAQEKGWWKGAGIQMSFKPWASGVTPETDVPEQGGNTFGFQSGAAIAIARSKGVPIRSVYADVERSTFGLMVLANSSYHKLTDLKGKRIGYKSSEFYVPATMMACAGLSQSDWKPVEVSFDTSVLTQHQVDADPIFIVNEPIALRLQGVKTRVFPAADHCFHFYDIVMFTTDKLISSNPGLVRRVTQVVARGYTWAHQHPDLAAKLTVEHYFPAAKGTSAATNLKQQILESRAFGPFSKDPRGKFSGLMTANYWKDSVKTLVKYGLIKSKPSVGSLFTNRFNPNK